MTSFTSLTISSLTLRILAATDEEVSCLRELCNATDAFRVKAPAEPNDE
jgi:hypothetical protein